MDVERHCIVSGAAILLSSTLAFPSSNVSMVCRVKSHDFSEASSMIRLTNLLNAVLIVFVGIWSTFNLGNIAFGEFTFISISAYLTFFGCLLCCFELRIGFIEENVRKYFGFMFTFIGRAVFLIFLGMFCIGLYGANSGVVGIVVGVFTFLNALLNCFVMYRHGEIYADPTAKYTTADSAAKNYMKDNPEITQQAFKTGMNFAASNPDLARQGMSTLNLA